MSVSLSYNGLDFQDSDHVSGTIQHESGPTREILTVPLANADGEVFVNSNWRIRTIVVSGWVKKDTQALLDTELDDMKLKLGEEEKSLVISYAGTTRTYTATVDNFDGMFERQHFETTKVRYEIIFRCSDPWGRGALEIANPTVNCTATPTTTTISVTGTAMATPVWDVTINTANSMSDFTLRNDTTNEEITIEPDSVFSNGDVVQIDSENKTVLYNGSNEDFTGAFPRLTPVTDPNDLTFSFASAGEAPTQTSSNDFEYLNSFRDERNVSYNASAKSSGNTWNAQSFQVDKAASITVYYVLMKKESGETQDAVVEFYDDDGGGEPDTGASLGSASVAASNISTNYGWVAFDYTGSPIPITTGTTYHAVLKTVGSTGYTWRVSTANPYPKGNRTKSDDAGASWDTFATQDFCFELYTNFAHKQQQWKAEHTGNVTRVDLYLKRGSYGTARDIILEIYTDSGGDPNTLLTNATKSITGADVPETPSWVPFTFATAPSVVNGTIYHVGLRVEGLNTYLHWYKMTTNPYADGHREYFSGATWTDDTTTDMTFKIFQAAFTGFSADVDVRYTPKYK